MAEATVAEEVAVLVAVVVADFAAAVEVAAEDLEGMVAVSKDGVDTEAVLVAKVEALKAAADTQRREWARKIRLHPSRQHLAAV